MNAGTLIAFEGIDGCGKTTQLHAFAASLRAAGTEPVVTREPTDGATGQRIRAMARSGQPVPPEDELRWFFEDRREHVDAVIAPALAAGRIVLTDRYYLSTVAYQGARGLDPAEILARSEAAFPHPDLILFFDIEPERALARVAARSTAAEPVFEESGFLAKAAQVFRSLDLAELERIDADRSVADITADVRDRVQRRLGIET